MDIYSIDLSERIFDLNLVLFSNQQWALDIINSLTARQISSVFNYYESINDWERYDRLRYLISLPPPTIETIDLTEEIEVIDLTQKNDNESVNEIDAEFDEIVNEIDDKSNDSLRSTQGDFYDKSVEFEMSFDWIEKVMED